MSDDPFGFDAMRREIAEHGFKVLIAPESDDGAAYASTVGLTARFGHPEFVVVGLDEGVPEGVMHELLDAVGERVAEGERFSADTDVDFLEKSASVLRRVNEAGRRSHLAILEAFYGDESVDVLQIVWPDRRGIFPWSDACDADVRARQDLLFDLPS